MTFPTTSQPPFAQTHPFSELSVDNQRNASSFGHFIGFWFGWIGALTGYLILRHRGALVRQHYAAQLNFQLSFLLYTLGGLVFFIPVLGIVLAVAFIVLRIVFTIIAAKQAHRGEYARIPMTIKFVS